MIITEGGTMIKRKQFDQWRGMRALVLGGCLAIGLAAETDAQTEQQVEVKIRDFTFIATKAPLMLNVPAVITLRNEDGERHDFRSPVFQGILTHVESGGAVMYGRGIAGVFVDPNAKAVIRFTVKRPGRYEFKCSIHPKMKGELLLLDIQSV
jgi:plastocyanin